MFLNQLALYEKVYYNNYINLQKRYLKNHSNFELEFVNSMDFKIFEFIEKIVNDNPFLTYKKFISLINNQFDIKLNNRKMKLVLQKIKISKKHIRVGTTFVNKCCSNPNSYFFSIIIF